MTFKTEFSNDGPVWFEFECKGTTKIDFLLVIFTTCTHHQTCYKHNTLLYTHHQTCYKINALLCTHLSCFSFRHNLPYPLLAQIEPLSSQAVRFHDRHSFTQLLIEALTYCFISAFLINHTYLSLIYVLWPRLHCRIKFSLVSFSFSVGTCPVRLGHRCRTYFPCNFRI